MFHLKNSVEKHRPAEEFAAIRTRIARTEQRLEKTAWQLSQNGSEKAAGYLRRWLPSIVTFAEAIEGFEVHGTSNPSVASSANVTIESSPRRRYDAAFGEESCSNCHAVFSIRSFVWAIRSWIAEYSFCGRCFFEMCNLKRDIISVVLSNRY